MEKNKGSLSSERLSDKIRAIYSADNAKAETMIGAYIEEKLKGYSHLDRLAVVEELMHKFEATGHETGSHGSRTGQKGISELLSLVVGKDIPLENLSDKELMEKLSLSLNTIFDSLNQIIRVINTTLLGERVELETIRQIIGTGFEDKETHDTLQDYLDQIQEAFLVAHKAFQEAAGARTSRILEELDPDRISGETGKGLRFGPLRKAGSFDLYTEKFRAVRKWHESGRSTEELLREFEKICQKLYKRKARSTQ